MFMGWHSSVMAVYLPPNHIYVDPTIIKKWVRFRKVIGNWLWMDFTGPSLQPTKISFPKTHALLSSLEIYTECKKKERRSFSTRQGSGRKLSPHSLNPLSRYCGSLRSGKANPIQKKFPHQLTNLPKCFSSSINLD